MIESINKNAVSSSAEINQNQDINITAKAGANIKNVKIKLSANVSVSMMLNSQVNQQMQNDMKEKFSQVLDNASSKLPSLQIGTSDSNTTTNIKNIFSTNVSQKFGIENLTALSAKVNQNQKVRILAEDEGSSIDDVEITSEAELISAMVNAVVNEVKSELKKSTEMDTKASNVEKNPMSELVDSVGNGVSKIVGTTLDGVNKLFSFSPMAMIIIALIVIVGGYIGYIKYIKGGGDNGDDILSSLGSWIVSK
jgi:hypothetical protein